MKWVMQISVPGADGPKWACVKPSGSRQRYEYDDKAEAERMLGICYGDAVLCRGLKARVVTTEEADRTEGATI